MSLEDLTPEQRERISNVKTPKELMAIAKEEGYELLEEELGTQRRLLRLQPIQVRCHLLLTLGQPSDTASRRPSLRS